MPAALGRMTTQELRDALAASRRAVVLLPVGSVEPHGPHLPLAGSVHQGRLLLGDVVVCTDESDAPGADRPDGWIEATHPVGTDKDKTFTDGHGAATLTYRVPLRDLDGGDVDTKQLKVVATLYYQSIPPHYLKDRFKVAPDDPATKRLYYLTSHLDLSKTPVKGWKLRIASAMTTWSVWSAILSLE